MFNYKEQLVLEKYCEHSSLSFKRSSRERLKIFVEHLFNHIHH